MFKSFLVALCLLLVGCVEPPDSMKNGPDQCIRMELFTKCLSAVPTGPTHTVASNDWDEVVEACQDSAYKMSIKPMNLIKPECRAYN